jgi:hypothetical protein
MLHIDGETLGRLTSLVESAHELSCVLTLIAASTPPGELTGRDMDALTDLSYKILQNLDQLREALAQVTADA